jgi:hypothetical protein
LPGVVGATDIAEDKAIAHATKSLEGTWVLHEYTIDNIRGLMKGTGKDARGNRRVTYRNDATYTTEVNGRVGLEGTWKIVAVKDKVFHLGETPTKQNRAYEAILEIMNDDTIRVCVVGQGPGKRPMKFEVPQGSNVWLMTYKRLKQ